MASFILLPSAHHKRNPNGNACWEASELGNSHDTKFIMEKNRHTGKAAVIFSVLAIHFRIGTKGFFNILYMTSRLTV